MENRNRHRISSASGSPSPGAANRPSRRRLQQVLAFAAVALGLLFLPFFLRVRALAGASRPALVVDEREHDFGRVPQNTELEHRFRLTNRGNRPLDILRVKGCCGIEATLQGQKHINPGDSRSLDIKSWASYSLGKAQRSADVETNDPMRPHIPLTLSWQVVAQVTAVPASIDVGGIAPGQKEMRIVDLWNLPDGFRITGLTTTSRALRVEAVHRPGDALYRRVRVRLASAGVMSGDFHGEVRITTNDRIRPRVVIPIRATILGDVEIHPSQLSLGITGPHSSVTLEADIVSRSSEMPQLRLLGCSGSRYRLALRRGPDHRSYQLTVAPKGPLPSGRVADVVELRAGTRTLRIPISGYVDPTLD